MTLVFLLSVWAFSGDIESAFIVHEELYEPQFLRMDQQGRLYSNNSNQNILVFNPDGSFARMFGRRGDGPGEFRQVTDLGFTSQGTILVSDSGARKMSLLDSAGKLLKTIPIAATSIGSFLVFPDDRFVVSTSGLASFSLNSSLDSEPRYICFDLEGKQLATFGTKTQFDNPMATVYSNMGISTLLGDALVHAGIATNELILYYPDREVPGRFALTFVPSEVRAETKESKGADGKVSFSMRIVAEALCQGLVAEASGSLLMLRAAASQESLEKGESVKYQLVRIGIDGKVQKAWPGSWPARNLVLAPDGKAVYFINELEEDVAISRLSL